MDRTDSTARQPELNLEAAFEILRNHLRLLLPRDHEALALAELCERWLEQHRSRCCFIAGGVRGLALRLEAEGGSIPIAAELAALSEELGGLFGLQFETDGET